jgi:hypothetical protein
VLFHLVFGVSEQIRTFNSVSTRARVDPLHGCCVA